MKNWLIEILIALVVFTQEFLPQNAKFISKYGNGKHWFIQPAGEFLACDFCNAVTEPREEDEWNNWS